MTTEIIEDPRFGKLPQWAQQGIVMLQRQRDEALNEAAVARGESGPPNSDVWLARYTGESADVPLPQRSVVRFHLDGNVDSLHGSVSAYVEKGRLMLNGASALIVQPRAANVVWVQVES